MSVSSTRKVGLSSSNRVMTSGGRSQSVEDIDTRNSVLVRDEGQYCSSERRSFDSQQKNEKFSYEPNISTSLETFTLSGIMEENSDEAVSGNNKSINVYSSNQSIVRDEDVERIGRSYLKRFYEKNEPIEDVNELV